MQDLPERLFRDDLGVRTPIPYCGCCEGCLKSPLKPTKSLWRGVYGFRCQVYNSTNLLAHKCFRSQPGSLRKSGSWHRKP